MVLATIRLLGAILGAVLELDYYGARVEGDKTILIYKTTGIHPSVVEFKSKIYSILDLPPDIPANINVTEIKKGIAGLKEYSVEITIPKHGVGKLTDILAKKYGVFRKRKYSGEI